MRVAEEHAARLVEQPEWVLSEVLLSPDLAPQILAQLPTKEHAESKRISVSIGLALASRRWLIAESGWCSAFTESR